MKKLMINTCSNLILLFGLFLNIRLNKLFSLPSGESRDISVVIAVIVIKEITSALRTKALKYEVARKFLNMGICIDIYIYIYYHKKIELDIISKVLANVFFVLKQYYINVYADNLVQIYASSG